MSSAHSDRSQVALQRVVQLAGAEHARIAIIPTASRLPDTGLRYAELFMELGAASTDVLPLYSRTAGNDPELVHRLCAASCVFLTGGNQLRLSTMLGGTQVARKIRHRNAEGVVVAGTSAGAAILPEPMIAYGNEGATPRAGMVSLAPGFGLVNSILIDQHFRQRDRIGRLLAAMAYNPYGIGLGVDEGTAAVIEGCQITVVGPNAITVVDASELAHTAQQHRVRASRATGVAHGVEVARPRPQRRVSHRRTASLRVMTPNVLPQTSPESQQAAA
jgi:cyanophycinase